MRESRLASGGPATIQSMRGEHVCVHGLDLGECHAPGCPVWLGDPRGNRPWKSGWALSRYSGAQSHDTRLGFLVHSSKYGHLALPERRAMADEIAERMMGFIAEFYETPNLPFSECLAPPSHQAKPFELAHYLCEQISLGFGLNNASHHLRETIPVHSVKEVPGVQHRMGILGERMTVDAPRNPRQPRGFLIVDDVFETGATATVVCNALASRFPTSQFHLLTATYK